MAYKLLYIEDLDADSIRNDLESFGFEVETNNASDFNNVIRHFSNEYDAYILDYRLTAEAGIVDAPTYAQTLRSKNKKVIRKDAPVILISNEINKTQIYEDYTSQDLFDLSLTKQNFRKYLKKYSELITSFIKSYEFSNSLRFDINGILGLTNEGIREKVDYRFIEKFASQKEIKDNAFGCCSLIYNTLIKSIGPLIGKDILSARLGISQESKDWEKLYEHLDSCKYSGVFSDVYDRWWMDDVIKWWNKLSSGLPLRRTPAAIRVERIKAATGLNLSPIEPIRFYNSSNFWTICLKTKKAIDPSEAYIINDYVLEPWQENRYISHYALLEYPETRDKLSTMDRKDLREFLMLKPER